MTTQQVTSVTLIEVLQRSVTLHFTCVVTSTYFSCFDYLVDTHIYDISFLRKKTSRVNLSNTQTILGHLGPRRRQLIIFYVEDYVK